MFDEEAADAVEEFGTGEATVAGMGFGSGVGGTTGATEATGAGGVGRDAGDGVRTGGVACPADPAARFFDQMRYSSTTINTPQVA